MVVKTNGSPCWGRCTFSFFSGDWDVHWAHGHISTSSSGFLSTSQDHPLSKIRKAAGTCFFAILLFNKKSSAAPLFEEKNSNLWSLPQTLVLFSVFVMASALHLNVWEAYKLTRVWTTVMSQGLSEGEGRVCVFLFCSCSTSGSPS